MAEEKSRKPRDSRVLVTGDGHISRSGLPDLEYAELTEADWLNIQRAYGNGKKIPKRLREQLTNITFYYGWLLQNPPTTRSITSIVQDIEQWRRRTTTLRNSLWTSGGKANRTAERMELQQIFKQYFDPRREIPDRMFPLHHLARLLEGAEVIGEYFVSRLEELADGGKRVELWLVWAALIVQFCRQHNVPVQHRPREEIHPGFLYLLKKLQGTLRSKDHTPSQTSGKRRTKIQTPKPPLKNEDSSLRKEAIKAVKIADNASLDNLGLLLANWGMGWAYIKDKTFHGWGPALAVAESQIAKHKR